jgi:hypothetical protein
VTFEPDWDLEAALAEIEPPYRSRGEAQVGRLLNRYGLPFRYEQPTRVYDRGRERWWRPDFKLPTLGDLVVEYAGMPDRPDYATGISHKQRVYAANGIPACFIYPRDLTGPDWPERLVERIRYAQPSHPGPRYSTDRPGPRY